MGMYLVVQAFGRNLPSGRILVFPETAIVVTICRKQPEKLAEPPEKVTTAYSAILYTVLFHIAFIKSFFPAETLEVTPQPPSLRESSLGAMLQGKSQPGNRGSLNQWN